MSKNSMMLGILYDSELCHEDSSYSKAEKSKYNREYYQKHKQYWKDYYKTGHGIGRGPSQRPTTTTNPNYKTPYGPGMDKFGPTQPKIGLTQTQKKNQSKMPKTLSDFNKTRDKLAENFVGNAVEYTKKTAKRNADWLKEDIKDPGGLVSNTEKYKNNYKKLKEANKQLEEAGNLDEKYTKALDNYLKKQVKKTAKRNADWLKEDLKDPGGLASNSEKYKDNFKKLKEANKQLEESTNRDEKYTKAIDNYLKKHVEKNVSKMDQKIGSTGRAWKDVNEEIMRRQVNTIESVKKGARKKKNSGRW